LRIIIAVVYVTPNRRARILGSWIRTRMRKAKLSSKSGFIASAPADLGVGYGHSATKENLPMAIDDSIFAVIGESLFLGPQHSWFFLLFCRRLFGTPQDWHRFGIFTYWDCTRRSFSVREYRFNCGVIPVTGVPLLL